MPAIVWVATSFAIGKDPPKVIIADDLEEVARILGGELRVPDQEDEVTLPTVRVPSGALLEIVLADNVSIP